MKDAYLEELAAEAHRIRSGILAGKFRLVLLDTFCAPPEPCILGEFDSLESAIKAAKGFGGEYEAVCIYDDAGNCVFSAGKM